MAKSPCRLKIKTTKATARARSIFRPVPALIIVGETRRGKDEEALKLTTQPLVYTVESDRRFVDSALNRGCKEEMDVVWMRSDARRKEDLTVCYCFTIE